MTIVVCSGPFLPTSIALSKIKIYSIMIKSISMSSILLTSNFRSNTRTFPNLRKLTLRSASTSSSLKIKRSSRSMRPSIETDPITSMCSGSLTMKENSITTSLEICPNSFAPNTPTKPLCAYTVSTVFHNSNLQRCNEILHDNVEEAGQIIFTWNPTTHRVSCHVGENHSLIINSCLMEKLGFTKEQHTFKEILNQTWLPIPTTGSIVSTSTVMRLKTQRRPVMGGGTLETRFTDYICHLSIFQSQRRHFTLWK